MYWVKVLFPTPRIASGDLSTIMKVNVTVCLPVISQPFSQSYQLVSLQGVC